MHLRWAAAVLGVALAAFAAAAARADCTAPDDPKISVTADEAPVKQNRSQSHTTLTQHARALGLGRNGATFGDTRSQFAMQLHFGVWQSGSGNRRCVTLDSVRVHLTLAITVYLASELQPGSCPERAIIAHEQKHVDLDRKLLPKTRSRVATALAGLGRLAMTGATVEQASQRLQDRLEETVARAIKEFEAERNRQQDIYDTPEEYRKLSLSCSAAEINALLGQ